MQLFTRLIARAGEQMSTERSGDKERLPIITQGGEHDAGSEEKQEHWSVGCRDCDRRGARCLCCIAGLG
jgi:hypothetical protein